MATRKIHLSNALGVGDWGRKNRDGDCSSITDTGFNGGGLRRYHWLRRYVEYMRSFYPMANLVETRGGDSRFARVGHQGRRSGASTVLPIWVSGPFRPVRVRLIRGKTELLAGAHIVKKLGAHVCFGCDRFKVGQGGWEMMRCNDNRHWVFHLAPTACAYAKLDGYSGKLRKAEIGALQMQGDFWGNSAVRKVAET